MPVFDHSAWKTDQTCQCPKFAEIHPSAVTDLICRKAYVLWDRQCCCAHSDTGQRQVSIITLSFQTPTFTYHSPVSAVTKPESGLFAEGTFALFLACRELGTGGARLSKDGHCNENNSSGLSPGLPSTCLRIHARTHTYPDSPGPISSPSGGWILT